MRTNLFFTCKNSIPEKQDIPAKEKNHEKRRTPMALVQFLIIVILCIYIHAHIGLKKIQSALRAYVLKGEISDSNIIYIKDGQLIQENPKSNKKTVLKVVFQK